MSSDSMLGGEFPNRSAFGEPDYVLTATIQASPRRVFDVASSPEEQVKMHPLLIKAEVLEETQEGEKLVRVIKYTDRLPSGFTFDYMARLVSDAQALEWTAAVNAMLGVKVFNQYSYTGDSHQCFVTQTTYINVPCWLACMKCWIVKTAHEAHEELLVKLAEAVSGASQ
mmetsp:Transcript_29556/g.89466  ORF Transcript_29556/g.89466 Transcript_29556/m.89466 type:complete len:169 (-) Transcript_29556:280-786(-)